MSRGSFEVDKNKQFAFVEKAIAKGQYEKAVEALEQVLRVEPNEMKALNRIADIYLKKENFEKVNEYLRRLASVYTKDGFYSKAVAIYKRILKLDQSGAKETLIEVHQNLADLYGQLGLVSDAMSHYSIVVDHFDKAVNQEQLLKVLKKVSDLDPFNIDSQLKLAELFLAEGKAAEASETLARLEENISSRGNISDVIRVQERACDLFGKDVVKLQTLVDSYLKANEPKKALGRIQTAFRTDPRNPLILELLATTFINLKQPEKARAVNTELLKIYRQEGDSEKAFAIEERLKNGGVGPIEVPSQPKSETKTTAEESTESAEALMQSTPMDPEERKILAECEVYLKYGLADKAQEVLSTRLGQFPQSLPLRWKLKATLQELQKTDDAAHVLSEIILLASGQKLTEWAEVAAKDLRSVAPDHPSLSGMPVPQAVSPDISSISEEVSVTRKAPAASDDFSDLDQSDISIIVDDDFGGGINEVSEISVKESVPAMEEGPMVLEDSAPQEILSESDFSPEELDQLGKQLELEGSPAPKAAPMATANELEPNRKSDITVELELAGSEPGFAPAEVVADDDFEIRQGLEEVEFFRTQGLNSEAENLLASLKSKFPQYAGWNSEAPKAAAASVKRVDVKHKAVDIEALGTKMKLMVQEDDRSDVDADFYDLANELNDELETGNSSAPAEVKDVFNAFKKGVSQSVSADDWQTHFDLGIAYREMGLLDDAMEEFKLVQQAPGQKVSALYQLGVCEMGRENYDKAKEFFDLALKEPELMGQEKLSVSYDLAEVLLKLNNKAKAKKLFEEVQKLDPEFREIREKMKLLG